MNWAHETDTGHNVEMKVLVPKPIEWKVLNIQSTSFGPTYKDSFVLHSIGKFTSTLISWKKSFGPIKQTLMQTKYYKPQVDMTSQYYIFHVSLIFQSYESKRPIIVETENHTRTYTVLCFLEDLKLQFFFPYMYHSFYRNRDARFLKIMSKLT